MPCVGSADRRLTRGSGKRKDGALDGNAQKAALPVGVANGQIDVKRSCKSQFVSRSWKILAVAPSANNRGLIVFEMAESPRRNDLQGNAGSGAICRSL